jgi:hypothetical protein
MEPRLREIPMIRVFLIVSLLQLVAFWKILGRMGFPPWFAIMAAVPVVNLLLLYYVALSPWPREARWTGPAGREPSGQDDAKF